MAEPSERPPTVLHITDRARWEVAAEAATNLFTDPSLDTEGFIHCSTSAQVLVPANERFAGRSDLVLLVIDLAAVTAEVRWEDCYSSGQRFPHIYGPIPVAAVTDVVPFPCNHDGTFRLPDGLAE